MNINFGKALNLLDGDPKKIIHAAEEKFDGIEWEEKRISRRQMPGEFAQNGDLSYSTQPFTLLLLEKMNIFLVANTF